MLPMGQNTKSAAYAVAAEEMALPHINVCHQHTWDAPRTRTGPFVSGRLHPTQARPQQQKQLCTALPWFLQFNSNQY